jgi:peroxiredoxin
MTIQTGDRLPDVTLTQLQDKVESVGTHALFGSGKAVLFAVPGAFTPTCSARHLPGFVEAYDAFAGRGYKVACFAVNDAYVMDAWGKSQHVPDGLLMLADGNAEFARALGLELDATKYGMGVRSKRFALVVEDGIVQHVFVDAPGEFKVSSAEHVLEQIG